MAFKLAIGNVIGVKLKGTTRDENGNDTPYEFTLVCDRVGSEELRRVMTSRDITADTFFEKHARNWRGNVPVVNDDGSPAEFAPEALRCLFTIEGMAARCWEAYVDQVVAVAKN